MYWFELKIRIPYPEVDWWVRSAYWKCRLGIRYVLNLPIWCKWFSHKWHETWECLQHYHVRQCVRCKEAELDHSVEFSWLDKPTWEPTALFWRKEKGIIK